MDEEFVGALLNKPAFIRNEKRQNGFIIIIRPKRKKHFWNKAQLSESSLGRMTRLLRAHGWNIYIDYQWDSRFSDVEHKYRY